MTDRIDRERLLIPALGGLYSCLAPFSYAFMRFSAGAILVPHGVQKLFFGGVANTAQGMAAKGFPEPLVLAYVVGFVELVGGAAVAIGLFTRFWAVALWIQMAVIIVWFVGPNGYFWGRQGYEFALLWLLLFTAIAAKGGGRWSVDHCLAKEL